MTNDDARVDRRGFLKVTTAAGVAAAGAAVAGTSAAQEACVSPEPFVRVDTPLQVRRVVTGHDENGRSVVAVDEIASNILSRREGHQGALIWSSGTFPVDNTDPQDGGMRQVATTDANGTVFRVVKYDPGVVPRSHRTESVDYAVVMSGEIDMELDEGVVTLRQGDVLVQRGTIHNWINRGTETCVIAVILVHAKPVEAGGQVLHAHG